MVTATVADAEHVHDFVFNGKQDTVEMRLAAIKQLAHFKRNGSVFGRKRATLRHLRQRVDGFSQRDRRNQRNPVSPACCDSSHSRIVSASCSAWGVTSTRKAMLQP